ncbi:hypothetical protein BC832DRAFT_453480 [Gaertneriomyces semiglobifer]|nr:hypothetical protein BC832DRAFT_453480 [Gaertneriomyces semiglobifer]
MVVRILLSLTLAGCIVGIPPANCQSTPGTSTTLLPLPRIPCSPPLNNTLTTDDCKAFNPAAVCVSSNGSTTFECKLPSTTPETDVPPLTNDHGKFHWQSSTVFMPCVPKSAPASYGSYASCPTAETLDALDTQCPPSYMCAALEWDGFDTSNLMAPLHICLKRISKNEPCRVKAGMRIKEGYGHWQGLCENPSHQFCHPAIGKCVPFARHTEGSQEKCCGGDTPAGDDNIRFPCPCGSYCLQNGSCIAGIPQRYSPCQTDGDCPMAGGDVCHHNNLCGAYDEFQVDNSLSGRGGYILLTIIICSCMVGLCLLMTCCVFCNRAIRKRRQKRREKDLKA